MGKGDKRTEKGKRFAGSYGKARPKTKTKSYVKPAAATGTKTTASKPAAKTTATKKSAK